MDAPAYPRNNANPADRKAAKSRKTGSRLSRSTLALLSGVCAVAIVLSGIVIAGFVAPDTVGTDAAPSNETAQAAKPELPAKPAVENTAQAKPSTAGAAEVKSADAKPAAPEPAAAASGGTAAALPPEPNPARPMQLASGMPAQAAATSLAAPLIADDKRWGLTAPPRNAGETAPQLRAAAGPAPTDATFTPLSQQASGDPLGAPETTATDDVATAALPEAEADVPVAETEADIAKLEAETGMTEQPAPPGAAAEAPEGPLPKLSATKVTKYVNLRATPSDEGRVLTVVPANAAVEAETGCEWCTAVYNGQRGYIYKSFLSGRGGKEASAEGVGLY